ncbi:hypothetical protein [Pantanalinema sp. GBBB05]|uniref:hypothetical protein n=1 Tax=Pantanalinema sp. GBBB05 TaxID=2604139 RepID=UPI001D67E117|nr:hypothetical protein [Pantanalinema sp. GBBB05]
MARTNGSKTESVTEPPVAEASVATELEETTAIADEPEPVADTQDIDDSLNALKALLGTVEKLQKVRQEVGDIKPLLVRMLDGEVITGEELEQLKTGVGGLFKLVRAYTDHQTALAKAQPARELLDQVLKVRS